MTRVLFIARYHDLAMQKKIEYMAKDEEFDISCVYPLRWQDAYGYRDVHVLPNARIRVQQVNILGRPDDPHRAAYQTLSFGMSRIKPHIIHAEEEPDSLAALQIAIAKRIFAPQAHLVFNTWQNILRPMKPSVKAVLNVSLSSADAMFCASEEAKQVLKVEKFNKPVFVIPPNGVDTDIFKPCAKDRREKKNSVFTLGYLGRFIAGKGLETVLIALRNVQQQVRFVMAGAGQFKEYLQDVVAKFELGDRVIFQDSLRPSEVPNWLCNLDALILPSITTPLWKEQFGRVLTEAMSCGIPVIGSNSGAIPEVIGDAGLVFTEGDHKALATLLNELIQDTDLQHRLSRRGYERVLKNYSQDVVARQTLRSYQLLF